MAEELDRLLMTVGEPARFAQTILFVTKISGGKVVIDEWKSSLNSIFS